MVLIISIEVGQRRQDLKNFQTAGSSSPQLFQQVTNTIGRTFISRTKEFRTFPSEKTERYQRIKMIMVPRTSAKQPAGMQMQGGVVPGAFGGTPGEIGGGDSSAHEPVTPGDGGKYGGMPRDITALLSP
ncbi:hypothetical protein SBOR_7091 [Sclerotinia borealis F-4128]|uniref:Uncharacterized protein n=1 Tax=Sclerotinia borealis (strain F-4128) TaxID=1432307 RepID=W9CCG2_SCLBF|nr:hypothetical protein SBOR_7091 [Sclerotinia borealis F-4128]